VLALVRISVTGEACTPVVALMDRRTVGVPAVMTDPGLTVAVAVAAVLPPVMLTVAVPYPPPP
jgi:hypothetical protein